MSHLDQDEEHLDRKLLFMLLTMVENLFFILQIDARLDRIYAAEVNIEDHIRHKTKNVFTTAEEYFANPEQFTSIFHKDIAPYSSMVINGAYWDKSFPRLMTTDQLKTIQSDPANKFRMLSIADISCDMNVSLSDLLFFPTSLCFCFFGDPRQDADSYRSLYSFFPGLF